MKITLLLKIIHGGGGNSLINNSLDTYTHYIDDYSFLEVKEITNTPQDNEYLSSLGLLSTTKSENLPNGAKYTILAYKKIGNSYTFHVQKEFTVGDVNPKIELNSNQNYTLFVVSTGNGTSAKIKEVDNIDYVSFRVDGNPNIKFLYQKIENFVSRGGDTVLDVKLKGTPKIRVIIDIKDIYPDVTSKMLYVKNIRLTYKKSRGIKLIDRSNVAGYYNDVEIPVVADDFLSGEVLYKIDFQDILIIENNLDFEFKAYTYIKTDERVNSRNNSQAFACKLPIKSGFRHTFVLKPKACGAYMGDKINWRQIMCLNLGEDSISSTEWNNAEQRYYKAYSGNWYTWGRKAVVHKVRDNPYFEQGSSWLGENDPCPSDYKVLSVDEFNLILDERNNAKEKIYDSNDNVIGWKIGERLLFITHDSHYDSSDENSKLQVIWTSTAFNKGNTAINVFVTKDHIRVAILSSRRNEGRNVRCVRILY